MDSVDPFVGTGTIGVAMRDQSCGELTWMAKDNPDLSRIDAYSEIWSFVKSWIRRLKSASDRNVMERFIYLWVTVNAWAAMAVADRTINHVDAYLVHSLSIDRRFNERFELLMQSNRAFQESVSRFTKLSPVFKVLWMRNVGLGWWESDHESRFEFIEKARKANPFEVDRKGNKRPAFAPSCAFNHIDQGKAIPADWPHVMSAIYQVRCNLFHGGKDYQSERDRTFVELAYNLLWEMWSPEIPKRIY